MHVPFARIATCWALCAALGTLFFACFDLFHSTRDIRTACEVDAQAAPSCQIDAGTDAPSSPDDDAGRVEAGQDFCSWSSTEALARATLACAWLGACETPMGRNAFGPCMFHALLAYDCAANPNHAVRGKRHVLWDCLSRVQTCHDVDTCIFPLAPQSCGAGGNYTACGSGGDPTTASNSDVRFECVEGGLPPSSARGENCALWGQTCATGASGSACAGGSGLSCTDKECEGVPRTELHWCVGGTDIGIDCAGNGAQSCAGFPDPGDASWLACVAENDAEPCAPDASASCTQGIAWSCPSGVIERIDCAKILQSDGGCAGGPLDPRFDWTSPCVVSPSQCVESCTDGGLIGCARGATFPLDCALVGLGACRMVSTDTQSAQHPACSPPAP